MANLKEFLGSTGLGALWTRITEELNKKATSADLADVATSGSYNDLEDKPFIPSAVSDLTDDSGHYTKPVNGIPASDLEETYLTSFTETDPTVPSWAKAAEKPEYTAAEVGAMATDHPANNITSANIENWTKKTNLLDVSSDHNNVYDYWWTLTIPRDALWDITNAPGTSGKLKYLYVPSTEGKNLIKLELPTSNGKLALISDTPAWARAAQKPTYTAQEVGALPADTVIPSVPTNVSAFTNDAGYLTQHQDISGKADKSEIPTSVSELTNDAGYIIGYTETDPTVPAWAKASTKPSYTAAEVGAPTIAEMNSAIGSAIGNVHQFEVEIVQELPIENIKEHTVYFVPKSGATDDVYDEYIYINNAWEMIGNTQIDLSNYVQKTDYPDDAHAGVIKVNNTAAHGLLVSDGTLAIVAAAPNFIKEGTNGFRPITPKRQDVSTFYGLAKAAGDTTQAQSDNAVGTYTDAAKTAIRTMLGVATPADIPTNVSAFTNDAGYLTQHQSLDNYVQKTDYATSDSYGLVKVGNGLRISSETGLLSTNPSFSESEVKPGTNGTKPIVPGSQHYSTFYGLSKAAGVDLANETVTFGTYPEASKTAIRSLIDAAAVSDIPEVPVEDVQINGTSILDAQGVANVPVAGTNNLGLVKLGTSSQQYGLSVNANGIISIARTNAEQIKAGTDIYRPIVTSVLDSAVFYGLAKAAGDSTQKESSFAVGKYTDMAKQAIQNMLGITRIVANQETQYQPAVYRHPKGQTFLMNGLLFKALRDIEIGDIVLPEDNCNAANLNYAIFAPKETSTLVRPSYLLNRIQDPTLSAQVNSLRANHLAFLPADQIIIEKTTDGGVTWEDAEISDAKKVMLFSELRPSGIALPTINGEKNTLCGLRVTFTAMKYNVPENTPETQKYNYWNSSYVLDRERYNTLREFYFWINSDADTMTIKAERAKGNAANNWETIFENNKARFTGWAGNDYISFEEAQFGGGVNQTSYHWNYRLTFMTAYKTDFNEFNQTYVTSPQSIYEIRGYGSSCWTQGNNYAGTDHLYSFDRDQNAYFPRSVNANNFNGTINGYDVRKNVPANAIFTDTTYESKAAISGGTAVSLVTTGEKYTWNQKVNDVQVNGTSVVSSGTANIPIASPTTFGVVKTDANSFGIKINEEGRLYTVTPGPAEMKAGTQAYKPIVPATQHTSVFYGLAKVAGADMASSDNAVGTYTESAKTAIRSMIGATSSNVIAVQDTQPVEADAKIWMMETAPESVEIPTMEDLEAYVQKTDIATETTAGIMKVSQGPYGVAIIENELRTSPSQDEHIQGGTNAYRPLTAMRQHKAVYFGLSKLAGVDLANETVTVGTYPETSKTAIRSLIGAIGTTDYATSTTGGTIRVNTANGVNITNDGQLFINQAATNNIKQGTANYFPIVPSHQHEAAFYGLAKAAGDTTMTSSSNAVGTYTETAKAAIRSMLGVETSIELIETVSGTTPTIVGQPNVTYQCGEVSTISITPPANGTIDVYFTSGSTAAALTIPSIIKWPAWFDVEALEPDTIYELMITNGIYGSVMTWAL